MGLAQLVQIGRHDFVVEALHALAAYFKVLAFKQVFAHHRLGLKQLIGSFFADVVAKLRFVGDFVSHHFATIVIPCV